MSTWLIHRILLVSYACHDLLPQRYPGSSFRTTSNQSEVLRPSTTRSWQLLLKTHGMRHTSGAPKRWHDGNHCSQEFTALKDHAAAQRLFVSRSIDMTGRKAADQDWHSPICARSPTWCELGLGASRRRDTRRPHRCKHRPEEWAFSGVGEAQGSPRR